MLALSALGLCALPEPAQARCWDHQPRSWPEYKAACECEGGHATQHPLRCNHAGNSTAPVHPGLLQRQRWQLLLQKNIVDVASYAALPVNSDAELVAALVRLYAELYQGTAIWNAEVMTLKARYDVTMAQHKEFYGPRASRIDASDGLEPGIRADHQKARAKLTQLQAELKRVLAMRANIATKTLPQSEQMRREVTIATRRRIYYFVGRVDGREVEHFTLASGPTPPKLPCCGDPVFPVPFYWNQGPAVAIGPQMAAKQAADALQAARKSAAPTLTGDVETRLQAVEVQSVKAAAARKSVEEWREYSKLHVEPGAASSARTWAAEVTQNVGVLKATFMLNHKEIPAIETELRWMQDVIKRDAWEFYTNGAAAAAWTFFNKHVAEPAIQRIAVEMHYPGSYTLTDAEIKSTWTHATQPLFSAYDIYRKGKDGFALIEQVKKLEGTAEDSMLAVADVMGRADIGDYKQVGDSLFGNLDAAARDQVRAALDQVELPSPFKKFWEGYFTGVKPTFDQ
jgi:hypothetical protein